MSNYIRMLLSASLVLVSALPMLAQTAVDPSGHWEGLVRTRAMEVNIEFDIQKNDQGRFVGTFGQPASGIKGLPVSAIAVDGNSVMLVLKADAEPATFNGSISEDGNSFSGDLLQLGYTFYFNLRRTGEARIAAPPKSAAIPKNFEGTWNGVLEAGGRRQRLVLRMTNRPDGTATGTIVSLDGSGVEIPIGMTPKASALTIDVPSVSVSYVGELNADRTELIGTWTQGPVVVSLTFQRANK